MLMESRTNLHIVRSSSVLFMQHASTHWIVEHGSFITVEKISPEASLLTDTLNSWSQRYDPEERERFIDAVFNLFRAAAVDTWSQFAQAHRDLAIETLASQDDRETAHYETWRRLQLEQVLVQREFLWCVFAREKLDAPDLAGTSLQPAFAQSALQLASRAEGAVV